MEIVETPKALFETKDLILILFNHRFDDDEIIFQNHMDILNNYVLDTGFDPSEQFRCSREKMEQFIKPGNKTTKTK